MSRYRRALTGSTYFFTVVAYKRRPILCDQTLREALRNAIGKVRMARPFVINALVLLPDHLHCIWTLPEGDADFSARWSSIKQRVSVACRDAYREAEPVTRSRPEHHESTIWQRRFCEHRIRNERDFALHMDYIHYNPVRHRHVKAAAEWPYSTFHRHVRAGVYPGDWGGSAELDRVDLERTHVTAWAR